MYHYIRATISTDNTKHLYPFVYVPEANELEKVIIGDRNICEQLYLNLVRDKITANMKADRNAQIFQSSYELAQRNAPDDFMVAIYVDQYPEKEHSKK